MLSLRDPMADNTRIQMMQAAIANLAEQSDGYNEQLQRIMQTLASIQFQMAETKETHTERPSSSSMYASINER